MGCGCGGSTRREVQPAERDGTQQPENPRRVGGPGEPGYYWTGPKRGVAKAEPPKPADAA